ncbi:MAG: hypothetical protein EON89_05450 [Brevundimonas sp.]|nr:MAG: hypothetical protein EON89_05450 [Brevundimonas sp.]
MKIGMSLLGAVVLLGALAGGVTAAPGNPCLTNGPGSQACRDSAYYDPWWWEPYYSEDPGPVEGPICQQTLEPAEGPSDDGCILP